MGTISDKLMRIINTKEDIRQALILKGYDVPTSIPFKEYAKMISDLPCKVDDFPKLPGDVIRWHFGGLTNEMMAAMDDPRIEDADGKGRFLSFKNFAWGGMSGVGGYEMNFNLWTNNVPSIPDISMSTTTTSVSVSVGNSTYNNNLIYIHMNNWDINKNHWLKVTSTYEDGDLVFKFYNDNNSKNIELPANGYVNIPAYPEFKGNYMYISTTSNKQGSFTIEQLPLYPGFILGDGVDDFAVTEKELNFEDTYTVYTAFIPFQNNPTRNMILCGADSKKTFSMQYSSLVYVSFIAGNNYYINADFVNGLNLFACKRNGNNICIKNLLTNKVVTGTCGDWVENAGPYYLWKNAPYASFAKAAIAGQTICNGYFSTDEDDEKVLDWYKKQYPWLFPDQAWTVTGKTNEDEDRATIANITGNGNDLVLSNFGFAEGSGYNEEGEYAGYLVTDGVDDIIQGKRFLLHRNWTMVGDWRFMPPGKNTNSGIVKSPAIRLYNQLNNIAIYINRTTNPKSISGRSIKAVCSDGRIYLDDWSEFLDTELQTDLDNNAVIAIANYGVGFTKMIFKNLSFYDNHLLSKDECIKAYNYLQTLKAK